MKKLHLVYIATILVTAFIVFANSFQTSSYVGGPPAGRCGDPASGGLTCASGPCHSATVQTVSGWITSDIPVSGYVPGQTYTITATATQTGLVRFGFQISPQNVSGTGLGTLVVTNTTETQIVNTKYIEHKTAGTTGTGGSKTWTFNWIAPAVGTGDVTFYGAFNCANNNGNSGGDNIRKTTYTVSECQATAQITSSLGNTICNTATTTLQANTGETYQWSNGATTSSINASPGNYSVTVTQTGGCTAATNITINGTPPPTLSLIPTNTSCGNANGNITANITGTGPFTYLWNNGATTQNLSNVADGNYTLTITNASGCVVTQSTNVGSSTSPSIEIDIFDAICGQANGAVMLSVSSGSPPYSYLWSNGATTSYVSNLSPSNYTFTVTDANNCTDASVASISDLEGPDATAAIDNATCGNSNGIINITVTGGTFPYTYNWSNGDSIPVLSNLNDGVYSLTVTDSMGCVANGNYVVDQLSSPDIGSISGSVSAFVDSTYSYAINPQTNSTIITWEVSGGQIFGQGNDTVNIQWDSTGTQTIIVFAADTNNCLVSETLLVNVDEVNGINYTDNFNLTWSIFPNPSSDLITVSVESIHISPFTFTVRSIDGRIVYEEELISHQGVSQHSVPVNDLKPGNYWLQLKSQHQVSCKSLIILR